MFQLRYQVFLWQVNKMKFDSIDDVDNDMSDDLDSDIEDTKESGNSAKVRRRIDDLLEQKRLKELLDDTDDWDI